MCGSLSDGNLRDSGEIIDQVQQDENAGSPNIRLPVFACLCKINSKKFIIVTYVTEAGKKE